MIGYLRRENNDLKRRVEHQQVDQEREVKADNDNAINSLMDKVNTLTMEKERLAKALQALKEKSTLADMTGQDKQIWVLKKEKGKMIEEIKSLEGTINDLQKHILLKNLKIEELQKQLGVPVNVGDDPAPIRKKKTLADRLKNMF